MDEHILGVDPGLNITGYGVLTVGAGRPVVREAGVIRTQSSGKSDMPARLQTVFQGIADLVEEFRPRAVAVEQLYAHYQHPRTAILMGHARGVIFLAAAKAEIPVLSYSATRIKKTVTGSGRASKEQVQKTVMRELGLAKLPEPPDVADALAIALCHYYLDSVRAGSVSDGKT